MKKTENFQTMKLKWRYDKKEGTIKQYNEKSLKNHEKTGCPKSVKREDEVNKPKEKPSKMKEGSKKSKSSATKEIIHVFIRGLNRGKLEEKYLEQKSQELTSPSDVTDRSDRKVLRSLKELRWLKGLRWLEFSQVQPLQR